MVTEGWRRLLASSSDFLMTVAEFEFPIQRALNINENGCLVVSEPDNFHKRSQDLAPTFHDAGQMYWGRGQAFRGLSLNLNSIPMILPRWNAQDIDTLEIETSRETFQLQSPGIPNGGGYQGRRKLRNWLWTCDEVLDVGRSS